MTKKEIAYKLMVKHMEAEKRVFDAVDMFGEERRNNPDMEHSEKVWYRGHIAQLIEIKDTFNESRKALGVTDNQWLKAYKQVCLEKRNTSI